MVKVIGVGWVICMMVDDYYGWFECVEWGVYGFMFKGMVVFV